METQMRYPLMGGYEPTCVGLSQVRSIWVGETTVASRFSGALGPYCCAETALEPVRLASAVATAKTAITTARMVAFARLAGRWRGFGW